MHVHSFTKKKTGGNPAGVVLHPPEKLSLDQMKQVSKILHVSETAFVFPSKQADVNVRFFSPEVEVDLCGHATIATFYSIGLKQSFTPNQKKTFIQETKAAILPVHLHAQQDGSIGKVMMKQAPVQFSSKKIPYPHLAKALRVDENVFRKDLPQQAVSTGLFTLPVCVSTFDVLQNMEPDFDKINRICQQLDVGSLHVFTFDTLESNSLYHARNFAPRYGINEDPVTGTANGAVCSYLRAAGCFSDRYIVVEQGDIINCSGRVFVEFQRDSVFVGGSAVLVEEKTLSV